jgi:hypothetical protein
MNVHAHIERCARTGIFVRGAHATEFALKRGYANIFSVLRSAGIILPIEFFASNAIYSYTINGGPPRIAA